MSRETNHKGVNEAKRFLITLEREQKIIARFVAGIDRRQPFGLNASYYLLLIEVLLMAALATSFFYVIVYRQLGTMEIYLVANAVAVLTAFVIRRWFKMLKTRRAKRIMESLSRTVEEERRAAEYFIGNNEN